ncbi:MAG: GGDEF domain-containing protein [Vallitaleaceae bacterium]|nr:GGDEF domain-containing protein [Vallitaleaceae bacterium]
MKNIQLIWKIALLICFCFGTTIFVADLMLDRSDYSLVNRDKLKEFSLPWELSLYSKVESSGHTIVTGNETRMITLPYSFDSIRIGEPISLSNEIPMALEEDSYIFLRARHQFVQAYIDGSLIYSYGTKDQRLFGESPASAWIFIPIKTSDAGKQIEIQLTPAYHNYSNHLNQIYYGNRSIILQDLVVERIASMLMCIVIFILGVGMIIVSLMLRDLIITKSLYRLGILSIVTSVWSICIMNILQVVFGDPFALLNLEFLAFHLLLPVFLWFLLSFDYFYSKKLIHILFAASMILFIILNILQLMNIADYMNTIIYSHTIIAFSLLYLSGIGLKALLLKQAPEEVKYFIVSMLVLVVFLGIDFIMFYVHTSQDEGFYSRIGILIFIGIWMFDIIRGISKMMVRIAKTEIFEQLAFQDQLTGIANRRAFESELDLYRTKSKKDDLYLIAFDLNNLKFVNDHFGHESGDFAIKSIAMTLQEAFKSIGSCYRTGGDEFFALVPAEEERRDQDLMNKLEEITGVIREISESKGMEYSVAFGIAKLSENDFDIDATFRAADSMMYENKAIMKGENYAKN